MFVSLVSPFHLFFTKWFLYLFVWDITFLLSPIICVHFFFCHSSVLPGFDLLQEYTLFPEKKNCALEPPDSNYVHSVPFSLAFRVVAAVNNILFLFSIQGAERMSWRDRPWVLADQRTGMRLLSISLQCPVNPRSQQQTHGSLPNSNLSGQHLPEWRYFRVQSGSVSGIKPAHLPSELRVHVNARGCNSTFKVVKTGENSQTPIAFQTRSLIKLCVFCCSKTYEIQKFPGGRKHRKMLLLVYLLGVTAQFGVGCAEPGWNKSFAPLPCSSLNLLSPVMDFIMDLEIISSSHWSESHKAVWWWSRRQNSGMRGRRWELAHAEIFTTPSKHGNLEFVFHWPLCSKNKWSPPLAPHVWVSCLTLKDLKCCGKSSLPQLIFFHNCKTRG